MDNKVRREILTEAIRIGDELLSIADKDEKGISWKLMGVDKNNKVKWHKSVDIYSGVSGIVLFFLELFKQTQKEDYLNAAVEGIKWVEYHCQQNPSDFYAFFTGRMGVSYTMLKMYDIIKENQYLDKALMIAQPCATFLEDFRIVGNLVNGASGTILGLLHLHTITQEKWILEKINLFVQYLLESAHFGPLGLYWDRSYKNISGLCGFSYGASGIGFVFLELGHYFKNEAFYFTAEQAFLYESYFYDNKIKNWPYFRKVTQKYEYFKKHEKAYLEGNLEFFSQGSDLNTWSFGAAGIGLARLRAFELLKKKNYENELKIALEKTKQTDIEEKTQHPLFVLNRGSCGNAELFLESYKVSRNPTHFNLSEKIALRVLAFKRKHNDYLSGIRYTGKEGNTSLFMGNPGIGYFYLKMLEPLNVPSIQMPKLETVMRSNGVYTKYPYINVSIGDVKRIISKQYFKRSITVMEFFSPQEIKKYFNKKWVTVGFPDSIKTAGTSKTGYGDCFFNKLLQDIYKKKIVSDIYLKEAFVKFMERTIATLPMREQRIISDIFTLELEKKRMDEKIKSHILLYIKERIHSQQIENRKELTDKEFLDLKLVLDKDVKIKTTAWDWSLALNENKWKNNYHLEPAIYPVLLKPSPLGIHEIPLSVFADTILRAFQKGGQLKKVIPTIICSFDELPAGQDEILVEKVTRQIKEAFLSGILVEL